MPFIEKQRHGDHTYFYLVKSVRVSPTKVRKVRNFLGRDLPPKERIQELLEQLERKLPPSYATRWLEKGTAERLEDLKAAIAVFRTIPGEVLPKDFLVRFTYNTNAIEGNPLTMRQTALLLIDGIAPEGTRIEHVLETLNSKDAWEYIQTYRGSLGRPYVNKVQYLVTKNTSCRIQGDYRDSDFRISGSEWRPPSPTRLPKEMEDLFARFKASRRRTHPVELATMVHNGLVRIHPFTDGNGRTARLLMNWTLVKGRFPPVIIEARNKEAYYSAIEKGDAGEDGAFAKFLSHQLIDQYSNWGQGK